MKKISHRERFKVPNPRGTTTALMIRYIIGEWIHWSLYICKIKTRVYCDCFVDETFENDSKVSAQLCLLCSVLNKKAKRRYALRNEEIINDFYLLGITLFSILPNMCPLNIILL